MRVILLGGPGAGKGTQAEFITDRYQIPQISTGNILRKAIEEETPLGKQVKEIVEGGQLVPDELIGQLVLDRLKEKDCTNGYLLDGFPRTIPQAELLHAHQAIDWVLDIDVPADEIVKRLSGRRIHPGSGRVYHLQNHPPRVPGIDDVTGEPLIQRQDDSEETVRKRLRVYKTQTEPLSHYYAQFHATHPNADLKYVVLNGLESVDQIKAKIQSLLDAGNQYEAII